MVLPRLRKKPPYKERFRNGPSKDYPDDIVDEWRQRSDRDGVRDQTGGGREYGYY
jgi:hypothetical protein